MKLFTIGEVIEITNDVVLGMTAQVVHSHGLTAREIRVWQKEGVIEPVEGGKGYGNYAKFTRQQVIAMALAAQWWRVEVGIKIIKGIVECIMSYTEEELFREIEAGRTMILPLLTSDGEECILIPPTAEFRRKVEILDLVHVKNMVLRKIDSMESERASKGKSRRRRYAS